MAKYPAARIFVALVGIGFLVFFALIIVLLLTHGCSIVKFQPVE
ncbi:MAG: hypothetical protein WHV67_00770 [Thermoanaerobaculia bacterium]